MYDQTINKIYIYILMSEPIPVRTLKYLPHRFHDTYTHGAGNIHGNVCIIIR